MNVISIHAPAKGATISVIVNDKVISNFNPRSREGSDICFCEKPRQRREFQSTLPRRERQTTARNLYCSDDFNPRSREGSDVTAIEVVPNIIRFQSTLPRRERLYLQSFVRAVRYFNPRSREGSDRFGYSIQPECRNFNPRSREGSDSNIIQQISFSLYNTVYFVSNNIK